jgi:hypothetical protein
VSAFVVWVSSKFEYTLAVAHTLVMMYQMIALNVAVNSYDHALLTLLVSNQFVEIKGSVFKKFEKVTAVAHAPPHLLLISHEIDRTISSKSLVLVRPVQRVISIVLTSVLSDIVERFSLALMLSVVAFRNLIELVGSEFDFSSGFSLPKSFGWSRSNNVLWTISSVRVPLGFCSN